MNEVSKLIDRTITEVVFDSTVTTIGDMAFYYCSNLKELHFTNPVPPTINQFPWYGLKYVYVPEGSIEAYRTAFIGKIYKNSYGGTNIHPSTFVFAYQVPYWEEQSFECEVDETNTKTGMVTVVEKDTNPSSPTYNQTRTRTYEDLERCNPSGPSGNTFSKITQLADATTGKYIVVYDNGDGTGLALKASLIKNTSSYTNGINANNNFIDVSISDGYVSLSNEDTSTTAIDYDGNYISWTDPDTETAYRLCGRSSSSSSSSSAAFEYSSPNHQVRPESTTYGFSFMDNVNYRHIALYTNSTSGAQKFRWDKSSSEKNSVGIYKLN